MTIEIRTANGTYRVRKPVGRWGVRFLAYLFELSELGGVTEPSELTREERREFGQTFTEVLERFTVDVLPHIYVSGPYKPDEMPPEDILTIFVELAQKIQVPSFPTQVPREHRSTGTDHPATTERPGRMDRA